MSYYFCSLDLPTDLKCYIGDLQRKIEKIYDKSEFLMERKYLHLTFIFFGKKFNVTEDIMKDIVKSLKELPEKDRTLNVKNLEIFNNSFLVCKFNIPENLKKLKKEIQKKYNIDDKFENYNPHITLGKLRVNYRTGRLNKIGNMFCPDIELNNKSFVIQNIKFHI